MAGPVTSASSTTFPSSALTATRPTTVTLSIAKHSRTATVSNCRRMGRPRLRILAALPCGETRAGHRSPGLGAAAQG